MVLLFSVVVMLMSRVLIRFICFWLEFSMLVKVLIVMVVMLIQQSRVFMFILVLVFFYGMSCFVFVGFFLFVLVFVVLFFVFGQVNFKFDLVVVEVQIDWYQCIFGVFYFVDQFYDFFVVQQQFVGLYGIVGVMS